jgi:hypothetical protein
VITPDPEIIFDENIEIEEEGELNNLWEELQENGQAEGEWPITWPWIKNSSQVEL